MNVNKVIIVGNITRDPELKALPSGAAVATFSIATNEVYTKDGQKHESTEYHNIVAWGKTAENIARYMKKGSQIYVEGKLQTRSWDKDGEKRYRTEVVALNVQFGAKPKDGSGGGSAPAEDDWGEFNEPAAPAPSGSTDGGEINPEDIPF